MLEMLITSILGGSALISSILLYKLLNDNKKFSQIDFPELQDEIADLRLEYDRAKKFRALTNEKEKLERAINQIYEEKRETVDTLGVVKQLEENRNRMYFNLPTTKEIQAGNIQAYYKDTIDDFIKMRELSPGYHYFKLPVDERDANGDIIRKVIRSYNNVKEYSFTVSSDMYGSKGIEMERYCTLEVKINGR